MKPLFVGQGRGVDGENLHSLAEQSAMLGQI